MLNLPCRPVASSVHARWLRWTVPLACVWVLATPVAYAAETMAMPMDKGMTSPPPLSTYRNWRDEPLQDWTKSNDRVGEIGGWMTYLREAQPADSDSGQSGQDHHGHHGH